MSMRAPQMSPAESKGSRGLHLAAVASIAIGVAYLIGGWLGSGPGLGLGMFAIMLATAAGIEVAGRRSDVMHRLLERTDERLTGIDLRATAVTGVVLILADLTAFVVQLARGADATPYMWLGALAGGTYLVALFVFLRRG
jgi:hypothetical protein